MNSEELKNSYCRESDSLSFNPYFQERTIRRLRDAGGKEQMKLKRKILPVLLTAALLLAFGITAYSAKSVFGWGNNLEVRKDGDETTEVLLHTDSMTDPVEVRNGKLIFVVNGENTDITDIVSTKTPFTYSYTDEESITHYFIVGLNDDSEKENYGYGEYLRDAKGDWLGGYTARVNCGPDGKPEGHPDWYSIGIKEIDCPWGE